MPQGGALTIRVEYGTKTNGSASLGLARPVRSPSFVIISIIDTGLGIPPENLSKVMEPFFTTKPEGKGTGLGLPICRRIIHEHQGTIELSSGIGQGTTVRLTLPTEGSGLSSKGESGS
jgi:signal transduction histidine kinase